MTPEFEVLDHPADMGFRAHGQSLDSLFANSALALTNIVIDAGTNAAEELVDVKLEGSNLDELMFSWLSEILYQFDGERNIVSSCQSQVTPQMIVTGVSGDDNDSVRSNKGYNLTAKVSMIKFDPSKHRVKTYVKAVTFHQMEITNDNGHFSAQVYLDI